MKKRDGHILFWILVVIAVVVCLALTAFMLLNDEGVKSWIPLGVAGVVFIVALLFASFMQTVELPGEVFELFLGEVFQSSKEQRAFRNLLKKKISKEDRKRFQKIAKRYKKQTNRSLIDDIWDHPKIQNSGDFNDIDGFQKMFLRYQENAKDVYEKTIKNLALEKDDQEFVTNFMRNAYDCFIEHCLSEAGFVGIGMSVLVGQVLGKKAESKGTYYQELWACYHNPTPLALCQKCNAPLHRNHICTRCHHDNTQAARAEFLKAMQPILNVAMGKEMITDAVNEAVKEAEDHIKKHIEQLLDKYQKELKDIVQDTQKALQTSTNEIKNHINSTARKYFFAALTLIAIVVVPMVLMIGGPQGKDIGGGVVAETNWLTVSSKGIQAKKIEGVLPDELKAVSRKQTVYDITSQGELTQEITFTLSLDAEFKGKEMNVKVYRIDTETPVFLQSKVITGQSAITFKGKPGTYAVVLVPYIVSYYDGDELLAKEEHYHGDKLIAPAISQQTGYDTEGFFSVDGTAFSADLLVLSDETYYVRRSPKTYTVHLDANGGSVNPKSVGVTYSANYTLPQPVLGGYEFGHWVDEERVPIPIEGVWLHANDVKLTATWTPRTDTKYTVNHYQQNPTGEGYTLLETEVYTGTTDATVTPDVKTFAGFASPVQQSGTIMGDGSLVIDYYYDRNVYKITLDCNGGTDCPAYMTVLYGASYTLPQPVFVGYEFDHWVDEKGASIPNEGVWLHTNDVKLTATWTPRTDTKYTVNHYQQNPTGEGYTLLETEVYTGTTDATVTPATKVYAGFTAPEAQEGVIDGNGSLVIEYYYTRNTYTISFDTDCDAEVPAEITVLYGAEYSLPVPIRVGHDLVGWFDVNGKQIPESGTWLYTESKSLTARWVYKSINQMLIDNENQKIDASKEYSLDYFNLADFALFMNNEYTFCFEIRVYVEEKFDGYQEIYLANADNVKLGGYGYKVYSYAGDSKGEGWTPVITVNVSGEHCSNEMHMIYGAAGEFSDDWVRHKVEISLRIVKKDKYVVKHYHQNPTGAGYMLFETQELLAMPGTKVTPDTKEYVGFTAPEKQSGTVAGDGKLVINYYYTRNAYKVTFDVNCEITPPDALSILYGAEYSLPEPVRVGFEFAYWHIEDGTPVPLSGIWEHAQDMTLEAAWTPRTDTKYTVNHYQQNPTGEGYTLLETEVYTGTTNATVAPPTKEYVGFLAPALQEGTIFGDGSLVIDYYYTRNVYTIQLDANGGLLEPEFVSVLYGTSYDLPIPQRAMYDFAGWYTAEQTLVDLHGVWKSAAGASLTAHWTPKPENKYVVEHYQCTVSGEATLIEFEVLVDEAGAFVTPSTKVYVGFDAPDLQTETIASDGSLVIAYYYTPSPYSVTWNDGSHYNIRVERIASPIANAATGAITNGSTVYYGDELLIKYVPHDGYRVTTEQSRGLLVTNNVLPSEFSADTTPNKGKIIYLPNGGSGSMEPTGYTYNESVTLRKNSFTRLGYNFAGWKDSNGNKYYDGQSVKNLATYGDVVLEAQWTIITRFTLTYSESTTIDDIHIMRLTGDLSSSLNIEDLMSLGYSKFTVQGGFHIKEENKGYQLFSIATHPGEENIWTGIKINEAYKIYGSGEIEHNGGKKGEHDYTFSVSEKYTSMLAERKALYFFFSASGSFGDDWILSNFYVTITFSK